MDEENITRLISDTLRWAIRRCEGVAMLKEVSVPSDGDTTFTVRDFFGVEFRVQIEKI